MCVEQDPAQQNNAGDNAQRMVVKEGTLGIFSHDDSMTFVRRR
jgi:hypothetical protein